MNLWSWIGLNETQLKILFVVVAAAYAVYEYRSEVQRERTGRTLEWIERYQENEHNRKLTNFWISPSTKTWYDKVVPGTFHQELRVRLDKENLTGDVYEVLSFYRNLSVCARHSLCDASSACGFFFDDVQAFRENYRGLLDEWTAKFGDLAARDLAAFAQDQCARQFRDYCQGNPNSPYCL